jgi:Arc/MetJ family transcription regulator
VSRTTVDIDDKLVSKVMQMYLLKTKREAIQLALERLVGAEPMTIEEKLAMQGAWKGKEQYPVPGN